MNTALVDLVRQHWAGLLDSGFTISREEQHVVELRSSELNITVAHDPRGEIDVYVNLPGTERFHGWSYCGMVGRASVGDLLDIVLSKMSSEPRLMAADREYFEEVARASRENAEAWTAYHAGTGPNPNRRRKRFP